MRVLHVAAELYPWVKSGGLGDVAAALPPALSTFGIDVRLLLPGFAGFLDAFTGITDVARLRTPYAAERVRIGLARVPGSAPLAYLADHSGFYDRPGSPYADPDGRDWPDNHRRFGLFGWVAAELARGADPSWRPEILHIHDWHAGLAPAYLSARRPDSNHVTTVFTVHNLAYQGLFPAVLFPELALPPEFFSIDGVEFNGAVSFIKSGLFYADRLTTVSPTYAREIQTPAFGCGLEGLLRSRSHELTGILNGVDPSIWDPRHDPILPQSYGAEDAASGKRAAKAALQRRLGLADCDDGPLFGVVSRLTPQKGLDLLLACFPEIIADGSRIAILGSGDGDLEQGFARAAAEHNREIAVEIGYDEALSHLIIAGADAVLLPSRFEPCGLTQLYALRYGTLPVVRRVGGFADTVVDATAVTLADGSATGFAFDDESPAALMSAIRRADVLFREPAVWLRMMHQAMAQDFSWSAAARRYLSVYRELRPDLAP
ncbi:MAG: glycogen synthase GlgA [Alphaproteobacteria bacterium]|nr:glycogen synthase GlgA [Alphaproteobacteria bacterium]